MTDCPSEKSGGLTLSTYVSQHPAAIDHTLNKLVCPSKRISLIDISPQYLSVLIGCEDDRKHSQKRRVWRLQKRLSAAVDVVGSCGDDTSAMNIAICFRLVEIDLRCNALRGIGGIIAFRNVRKLNLSHNKLKTIECCEPLMLLGCLECLDLTGNPVCDLLSYRCHLVRILSHTAHLVLDNQPVTAVERLTSEKRIRTEEAQVLPAMQFMLWRFAIQSVVDRIRMHSEMRRLGHIVADRWRPLSIQRLLESILTTSPRSYCSEREGLALLQKLNWDLCAHATHEVRMKALAASRRFRVESEGIEPLDAENRAWAQVVADEALKCSELYAILLDLLDSDRLLAGDLDFSTWSQCLRCRSEFEHPRADGVALSKRSPSNIKASCGLHKGHSALVEQAAAHQISSRLRACFRVWKASLVARLHFKRAWMRQLVSSWRSKCIRNQTARIHVSVWNQSVLRRMWIRWKVAHKSRASENQRLREEWNPKSIGTRIRSYFRLEGSSPTSNSRLSLLRALWAIWAHKATLQSVMAKAARLSSGEENHLPEVVTAATISISRSETSPDMIETPSHEDPVVPERESVSENASSSHASEPRHESSPGSTNPALCGIDALKQVAIALQSDKNYLIEKLFEAEKLVATLRHELDAEKLRADVAQEELKVANVDRLHMSEAIQMYEVERRDLLEALRATAAR